MTNFATVVAIAGSALLLAACGGDSSGADDTEATTPVAASAGEPTATSTAESSDGSDETVPPDEASSDTVGSITLDGVTYEFGMNGPVAKCELDNEGTFSAVLYVADLTEVLNVKLYADETRNTYVRADILVDGTMAGMTADPTHSEAAIEPGTSFIDAFTIDGKYAEGTASFVNLFSDLGADNYPLAPVLGTFEVNCP